MKIITIIWMVTITILLIYSLYLLGHTAGMSECTEIIQNRIDEIDNLLKKRI